MAWALIRLGRSYQLGGIAPRAEDSIVTDGPYGLVRHPMYTAALSISLGLALLIHSWGFACVFLIYLALILSLIPLEEEGLRRAYGSLYGAYERRTRKLVPYAY
jgi:protein-S-isoprenylcysteine O-methyltransferase Ste14